ncbi:hypothetical protein BJY24_005796 [Nocardia transvalensis]|uniref:SpoVT-AbrB domain-containing protein n=1 Tax=Nocardia transvalensis TaxID=37333 RepID=A0A7W9PIP0_9NOCA|nr:hypothetical protein [Nocardia transvalensis]MBB5916884.1 hypothetical protein [Nocardia transvalensis]
MRQLDYLCRFWRASPSLITDRPLLPTTSPSPLPADLTGAPFTTPEFRFAISVLTDNGRLASSAMIVDHLEWESHQPISFAMLDHIIIVTPSNREDDSRRLDHRRHLRLPAAIRARARLRPGDTTLLVAVTDKSVLAIYPPPTVYEALHTLESRIWELE